MAKDRLPNNLRAWREFRRMTQEELAEKVGTTAAVISLLESGHRQLSLKWLQRFAPALRTTPGFILDHQPEDLPTDVLDTWGAIPEAQKPQALEVLKAFVKKKA
jgi:transcriptional regulator with XRE-family HTH domain